MELTASARLWRQLRRWCVEMLDARAGRYAYSPTQPRPQGERPR
ncbi:hypothetical protein [Nissabacter sp. SGAir0207]|nr:hypothetical protein [Nissabacter sp. SGAir0207]